MQATKGERTTLLPDIHGWESFRGNNGRHGRSDDAGNIEKKALGNGSHGQKRQRMTLRYATWTILRYRSSIRHKSCLQRASYAVELSILTLILLNVLLAMSYSAVIADSIGTDIDSDFDWYDTFLYVSTVIFSIEYILRLWACVEDERYTNPIFGRLKWMLQPMSLIDLIVLIPFYLEIGFEYMMVPTYRGMLTLRGLRLLRIMSFLRLERSYQAMKNLRAIFTLKKQELAVVTYLTAVLVVISSTTIFFLENAAQPDVFSSIGVSAWWAIETITSLGYGDIVPVTVAGRVFSAILALWGIILFTIPGAVLGSGFIEVMLQKQAQEREALEESLRISLSREIFSTNNNHIFGNVQYDSDSSPPVSGNKSSFIQIPFQRQESNVYLQDQVDQLTKTQARMEEQLKRQEAQLQTIVKLLEAQLPSSHRVELSDRPPFSAIMT